VTLVKPPHLQEGDAVGLISPAGWLSDGEIDRGAEVLKDMGFVPVFHPGNQRRDHHFAGPAVERAAAIEEMFLDDEVRAVMCTKGGYGTERLLDHLDFDAIGRRPKCVVGSSDVTALLLALATQAGLLTFYGPMLLTFNRGRDEPTLEHLYRALTQTSPWSYDLESETSLRVLRSGEGRGPLMGGNLTLVTDLIGTDYEPPTEGSILFFEDIDEELYRLDRMLLHLKRAGKLRNLKGILVGEMTDIRERKVRLGRDLDGLVLDLCEGTDFPIVAGFPCGHGRRLLTVPIGCPARLSATDSGDVDLALEQAAVD
jgi:muramoyltetrapeptide carboxypeptidase